jgi:serine/threonine-protein kinase
MQYEKSAEWVDELGTLPEIAPCWVLMVFNYALFIPNTWQRAAAIISIMSAAPFIGLILVSLLNSDAAPLVLADSRVLVEMVLIVALTAVSAILGVRTINSLRDEALRARQFGQYKLKRLIGRHPKRKNAPGRRETAKYAET